MAQPARAINEILDTTSAGDVSASIPNDGLIALQVDNATGTTTTCVVEIQGSVDDTNFYALGSVEVTGEGLSHFTESAAPTIRARVKTAQGATSTSTVRVYTRRRS